MIGLIIVIIFIFKVIYSRILIIFFKSIVYVWKLNVFKKGI